MTRPALDLMQGTLDVLILQTLTGGATHGYGISEWIRERTGGVLAVQDAALYKALRRLEQQGRVVAEWGTSENNRRARYYEITREGRRQLEEQVAEWRHSAGAVERVLRFALQGG